MTHPGIVTAIKPGFVTVQIESTSACAACAAHSKCGFAESKTKSLDIPITAGSGQQVADSNQQLPATSYQLPANLSVGDHVTVYISEERGLLAAWWAYFLPAMLLIAVAVTLSVLDIPEPLVILATLASLAIYILILYLLRKKLNHKFTLTLTTNH
jgi:sigma-E factor negative regulatory protein RseC